MVKAEERNCSWLAWRCPAHLARCVGVAVLLPVIALGLSHSLPVAAAVLSVPPEQVLEPGQQLVLPLLIRQDQGPRIEISLGVSPEGASLVLEDDGQLQLEWQAGPDLPAETTIELLVRDVDSNQFLDSVWVVIRRPDASPDSGADAGTVAPESTESTDLSPEAPPTDSFDAPPGALSPLEVDAPPGALPQAPSDAPPGALSPVPTDAPPGASPQLPPEAPSSSPADEQQGEAESLLQAPHFPSLPNQVVSAGRTVILKVFARLPGEYAPVLQVDRLPRNASFEANEEGGRTFRWETGENDQGEHLFRFTAFNPRAPQERSVQEVLMVVGDPTRKVTLPEPARGG